MEQKEWINIVSLRTPACLKNSSPEESSGTAGDRGSQLTQYDLGICKWAQTHALWEWSQNPLCSVGRHWDLCWYKLWTKWGLATSPRVCLVFSGCLPGHWAVPALEDTPKYKMSKCVKEWKQSGISQLTSQDFPPFSLFLTKPLTFLKATSNNPWFYASVLWLCGQRFLLWRCSSDPVICGHTVAPHPGLPGMGWSFRKCYQGTTVRKSSQRIRQAAWSLPLPTVCDIGQLLNMSISLYTK